MIEAKLTLCAENIIRDAATNNISFINLIENINSPGFPLFIQKFMVFNLIERTGKDSEQIDCELKIAINDKDLIKQPLSLNFQDKMKIRSIVDIDGLTIPNPGILRVILSYKEKSLGAYEISVNKVGKPKVDIESSLPE